MKITNDDEYEAAINEIEPFFDKAEEAVIAGPEAARFFELLDAIEEYESTHWP